MKYLLVLAVLGVAFWFWRNNRQSTHIKSNQKAESNAKHGPFSKPLPMCQCLACGVHLPKADAVTGHQGSYCSVAHRLEREN